MLRLIWSADAVRSLEEIGAYIARRNKPAADRLTTQIERSAEQLTSFPYLHRPGRVPGTREAVVHPNYIVVYEVSERDVVVLAVLHARQRYP